MRKIIFSALFLFLSGCAEMVPQPYEPGTGHIRTKGSVAQGNIPDLVQQAPMLPTPEPPAELEKYTVVVNEVPVKELLFALARDAQINVDIHPNIDGVVTINAVEQTLPQLLARIARQVELRYEFKQDHLIILPDDPFFRIYKVDYLNINRDTDDSISTDTGVGSAGGGGSSGSTSTTDVTSTTTNHFWSKLVTNVMAILGEEVGAGGAKDIGISKNVIPLPEAGIITIRANTQQHELIQKFLDNALVSANRQVLIQATIVEVTLNDKYQAGIDWSFITQAGKAGFDFITTTFTGVPVGTLSSFLLQYNDPNQSRDQIIRASLSLLEEFGDVSVLSSPLIMALNNQTAILKVVDNVVYFTVNVETTTTQVGTTDRVFESQVNTVPVGIVLSFTPQINENGTIILHIRPTISRILNFVNDPNPDLADAGVSNPIPQIQIREMESILRINNGQIAVLGGLMEEVARGTDAAIPGLSALPGLGELFKSRQRDFEKRELVVFIRPTIIRTPSLEGDLGLYKALLQRNTRRQNPPDQGK